MEIGAAKATPIAGLSHCDHSRIRTYYDVINHTCRACNLGVVSKRGCECGEEEISRVGCIDCDADLISCPRRMHYIARGENCRGCIAVNDPSDAHRKFRLVAGKWIIDSATYRCRQCDYRETTNGVDAPSKFYAKRHDVCTLCAKLIRNRCEEIVSRRHDTVEIPRTSDFVGVIIKCACNREIKCDSDDVLGEDRRTLFITCDICVPPPDDWLWDYRSAEKSPGVMLWTRGERKKTCIMCPRLCDEPRLNGIRCCAECVPVSNHLRFKRVNGRWYIDRYRAVGPRTTANHVWRKWVAGITLAYRCPCARCIVTHDR